MELFGRRKIHTPSAITRENIIDQVNMALAYHFQNVFEEDYLYWYRRGIQPILERKKEIRPEICNKIVVNTANQIVVFKNGYFLSSPAFYVSRTDDTDKVKQLNEFLYTSGKQQADNKVVNWFHTVGLGAVLVEPNREKDPKRPVCVYALDPRSAFVVYDMGPAERPVMGINVVVYEDQAYIDVFTKDSVYKITGSYVVNEVTDRANVYVAASGIVEERPNVLGLIPIVEYQFDENRMGAFEPVIPLMDEYNLIESNRADGVEQFIQSLAVAYNCDFEEGVTANSIRQAGMIVLNSIEGRPADFKIISQQLDQQQTEISLKSIYNQILMKAGVPSGEKSSGGTSDNVGAVYLRDGFAIADTHARNTEDLFKESNKYFDEVFLKIVQRATGLDVSITDIDLQFTRNEMNNLLVKTQGALNLKTLGFSPELAFAKSGLSYDPVSDVENSKKYIDKAWGVEPIEESLELREE